MPLPYSASALTHLIRGEVQYTTPNPISTQRPIRVAIEKAWTRARNEIGYNASTKSQTADQAVNVRHGTTEARNTLTPLNITEYLYTAAIRTVLLGICLPQHPPRRALKHHEDGSDTVHDEVAACQRPEKYASGFGLIALDLFEKRDNGKLPQPNRNEGN